jgi:hypothetical protein
LTAAELAEHIADERLPAVLDELTAEQLITKHVNRYAL